jgi:hypothetical protein
MCINLCIHHNIITVIIEDLLRVIQCTQFHIAFFITIFLKHIIIEFKYNKKDNGHTDVTINEN